MKKRIRLGVCFCDEPTGNLDRENSQVVMELLQKLNRNGMTVVMVTHDTAVAEYGTRVIHVEDGKIVEKGGVEK